jgi:hypothetical protein
MAELEELEPTGVAPFDETGCGCGHRMPCPEWLVEQENWAPEDEPEELELDPPAHLHDLWIALGLGEE